MDNLLLAYLKYSNYYYSNPDSVWSISIHNNEIQFSVRTYTDDLGHKNKENESVMLSDVLGFMYDLLQNSECI